jgi:hypothetical protein
MLSDGCPNCSQPAVRHVSPIATFIVNRHTSAPEAISRLRASDACWRLSIQDLSPSAYLSLTTGGASPFAPRDEASDQGTSNESRAAITRGPLRVMGPWPRPTG